MKTLFLSKYKKDFLKAGYVIVKNFLKKKDCIKACNWLQKKKYYLANSWTEQEPMVPLAVYFAPHNQNNPISKLAKTNRILDFASHLIGEKVYIWSSKVNLKAAWCGTSEYYHQDTVYWKDRGYKKDSMLSAMIVLEKHDLSNSALHVFPGSHKLGFIKHVPFFNINGLAKYMIPPKKLDNLKKKFGLKFIKAEPGDIVFFHASIVHGSSHNISGDGRMIILSQLNSINNLPKNVTSSARNFNLFRSRSELIEAKRKFIWFKKKYRDQLINKKLTFSAPIVKQEFKD